jgi:tripartite-type tricarboxylate transporter receptor subunit TctC
VAARIAFVVPFGKDGAADRAARAFAPDLPVEDLPGEGGETGVERANAIAEMGQPVLLLGTPTTHVLLPARLGPAAAPHRSFRAIAGLGSAPNVLLVTPQLGISTLDELVQLAREKPLVYASAGYGQTIHVCTALFLEQAGLRMQHRPYDRGSASAYEDFAAGRVHVYFDSLLGCRGQIEKQVAIPLAVSSVERHPAIPKVPTLRECGFDHALDVWLGVFGSGVEPAQFRKPAAAGLGALGLRGGPLDAPVFAKQVEASMPMWLAALEAAVRRPD